MLGWEGKEAGERSKEEEKGGRYRCRKGRRKGPDEGREGLFLTQLPCSYGQPCS